MNQISSPNSFINADARYFAVAASQENLWVGTSDGIARSPDGGESWHILRVAVPLRGGNQYQPDTPSVSTYAYPNPYSPTQHSIVRIKFEIEQPGPATLRIFDFGMNPVYITELTEITVSGSYETTWNGQTETGRIAANGTYFYSIETPRGLVNGKILLLD